MEQRFDGLEVAVFEGRFTGQFEIPHDVGAEMGIFNDEEYVFSVVVTPKSASFGETKTGDPKRTNTLKVVAVQYEGKRNPVTITVDRPEVGVDSLAGQQTVYDVLAESPGEVAERESQEGDEWIEDDVVSTPPPPAADRRVEEREPVPVGEGPVRDYSADPALAHFLSQ